MRHGLKLSANFMIIPLVFHCFLTKRGENGYPGRTRTSDKRTKISSVTITLPGIIMLKNILQAKHHIVLSRKIYINIHFLKKKYEILKITPVWLLYQQKKRTWNISLNNLLLFWEQVK